MTAVPAGHCVLVWIHVHSLLSLCSCTSPGEQDFALPPTPLPAHPYLKQVRELPLGLSALTSFRVLRSILCNFT